MALMGGVAMIDAIRLSLVFFGFWPVASPLATYSYRTPLFFVGCILLFSRRGAFQCPLFAPKQGLPPSSHEPIWDGMLVYEQRIHAMRAV